MQQLNKRMRDFVSALDKRDAKYLKTTADIIESIRDKVDVFCNIIGDNIGQVCNTDQEYYTVDTIDAVYGVSRNDTIDLIFDVTFRVGGSITSDDGTVVDITDDNVQSFNRMVSLSIPLEVLNIKSPEKIKHYFLTNSNLSDVTEPLPSTITSVESDTNTISATEAKRMLMQAKNPTGVKH